MCGRYYIEQEEDIAEMRRILDRDTARSYLLDPAAALAMLAAPPPCSLQAVQA